MNRDAIYAVNDRTLFRQQDRLRFHDPSARQQAQARTTAHEPRRVPHVRRCVDERHPLHETLHMKRHAWSYNRRSSRSGGRSCVSSATPASTCRPSAGRDWAAIGARPGRAADDLAPHDRWLRAGASAAKRRHRDTARPRPPCPRRLPAARSPRVGSTGCPENARS